MKLAKFRCDFNNDRVFSWNKKGKNHSHGEFPGIPGLRDPPPHTLLDPPFHSLISTDPPRPLMSLFVGPPIRDNNWKPNRALGNPDPPPQVKKHLRNNSNKNTYHTNPHSNSSLLLALNQFYNRPPTKQSSYSLTMPNALSVTSPAHRPLPLSSTSNQTTFWQHRPQ